MIPEMSNKTLLLIILEKYNTSEMTAMSPTNAPASTDTLALKEGVA